MKKKDDGWGESPDPGLSLFWMDESFDGAMPMTKTPRRPHVPEKMHEDFEYALWEQTGKVMNVPFEPTPLPGFYRDFRNTMASVAQAGGGDFIPLTEEKALTRNIIIMTFGSRWEVEMAKYLRDLE